MILYQTPKDHLELMAHEDPQTPGGQARAPWDQEFESAYSAHFAGLLRYACYLSGSNDIAADDLVQGVFLNLFKTLQKGQGPTDLKSYLYRTLLLSSRKQFRNWFRRGPRFQESYAAVLQVREDLEAGPDEETRAALGRALDLLPSAQKEVIALHIYSDLTFVEIGRTLNISPKTAESRYRLALEKLRNRLVR